MTHHPFLDTCSGSSSLIDVKEMRTSLKDRGVLWLEYLTDAALAKWLEATEINTKFSLLESESMLAYLYWFNCVHPRVDEVSSETVSLCTETVTAMARSAISKSDVPNVDVTVLMLAIYHYRQDLQSAYSFAVDSNMTQLCFWFFIFGVMDEDLQPFVQPEQLQALHAPVFGVDERCQIDALMLSLWYSEPKIKSRFPLQTDAEKKAFAVWFMSTGVWIHRLDYAYGDGTLAPWKLHMAENDFCSTQTLGELARHLEVQIPIPGFFVGNNGRDRLQSTLHEIQHSIQKQAISGRIIDRSCYQRMLSNGHRPRTMTNQNGRGTNDSPRWHVPFTVPMKLRRGCPVLDCLLNGWHSPEHGFVWQSSISSSIAMSFTNMAFSRLRIELSLKILCPEDKLNDEYFAILWNGEVVYYTMASRLFMDFTKIVVEIPRDIICRDGINFMTCISSDLHIPKDMFPDSTDTRKLGLGLSSLTVYPLPA